MFKELEPSFFRAILLTQNHHLSDLVSKHHESLPIISNFIVAREVLHLTNFDFRLTDFINKLLPAGRDQAILSHVFSVLNWSRGIENSNDGILGRLRVLQIEERSLGE